MIENKFKKQVQINPKLQIHSKKSCIWVPMKRHHLMNNFQQCVKWMKKTKICSKRSYYTDEICRSTKVWS